MIDSKYMFIPKGKPLVVLTGDLVVFVLALWTTLALRYFRLPDAHTFDTHLHVFSLFFIPWIIVNFVVGMYDHYVAFSRGDLLRMVVRSQVLNIIIAVFFFYFYGNTGVTPKVVLLIYLLVVLCLTMLWRFVGVPALSNSVSRHPAVLIAGGAPARELFLEIKDHEQYKYSFHRFIDIEHETFSVDELLNEVVKSDSHLVVADFANERVSLQKKYLFVLLFEHVRIVSFQEVYQSVFNKVALSSLSNEWFLDNVSTEHKKVYDFSKRIMDVCVAFPLLVISLVIFPLVYAAIKLDDGGPMFIFQERIGQDGKVIRIPKIRSMKTSDRGIWVKEGDTRITRVGGWLRKTRIDELPQLFSVMIGDLSLVGPRPDILDLGKQLEQEIPYYRLRTLIKPGLSGWAQVRQAIAPQTIEETRDRLAYDLYYLQNRSFLLDIKIALQTITTLASRVGR